jgi:hypothetical protein
VTEIEVSPHWMDTYPIPRTFTGQPIDPQGFLLEDDHMAADAIVVVGWIVPSPTKGGDVIVGTVTRARFGDRIEQRTSHGHSYLRNLGGRRLVEVFDPGPVKVILNKTA